MGEEVIDGRKDKDKEKEEDQIPPTWSLWTAGSYAFVMILIGLPLWWKTTAVQRVSLPYYDMANLRNELESTFLITIPVKLIGFAKLSPAEVNKFHNLDGHSFSLSFHSASGEEMDIIYKSLDIFGMDKEMCKLEGRKDNGGINPINVYYVGRADLLKDFGHKIILGNCRTFYYISNSSKIKFEWIWNLLRKVTGFGNYEGNVVDWNKGVDTSDTQISLPLSAGYNILLSLLVPEPEVLESKWEIEGAVKSFLDPILGKLSAFGEFSVRSQVLHYIRLNVFPKWNDEKKMHEVPHAQLPLVINPVESKLTSFVSQNPVLNFLTYASPCSKTPLQILESDGKPLSTNAFLVPQWGGIFIYNPPCPPDPDIGDNSTDAKVHHVSTEHVMAVVISQFRSLIGLGEQDVPDVLDFHGSALRDWEVDMILRKRLKHLLYTASNTLHSLGQLLDEITNIVVTEEVGDQVEKSVAAIKSAISEASFGKLESAQSHALEAFKSSEIAFHHPKNLKQLYFPDDQKYAIYIPLFLPVGIPVLISLRVIFKQIMNARKKGQTDKVKSD